MICYTKKRQQYTNNKIKNWQEGGFFLYKKSNKKINKFNFKIKR